MALTTGLSITKTVSFRGVQQPFSNVYYYNIPSVSEADAVTLANYVKGQEAWWHSADVTFTAYKVWTGGGTTGANHMISQGALTGVGLAVTDTAMDRERAVLVSWRAGNDSRGHPVYLRKWYHSCGQFGSVSFSAGVKQQTVQIPSSSLTIINGAVDAIRQFTQAGITFALCGPTGRPTTGPTTAYPWLEHHQLGDQWRP